MILLFTWDLNCSRLREPLYKAPLHTLLDALTGIGLRDTPVPLTRFLQLDLVLLLQRNRIDTFIRAGAPTINLITGNEGELDNDLYSNSDSDSDVEKDCKPGPHTIQEAINAGELTDNPNITIYTARDQFTTLSILYCDFFLSTTFTYRSQVLVQYSVHFFCLV